MRNMTILLPLVLLAAFSVYPVLAQTSLIADHVVINELDTNPNGADNAAPVEWVELYNPTSSDVNIGNWKISSTTFLQKNFTIPVGTILKSDSFRYFTYHTSWFSDVTEVVQLLDSDENVIDQTPTITDIHDNFYSWQRTFDGYDTESASDWEFNLFSVGLSNGKLNPADELAPLSITLDIDKSQFLFGDIATLSGVVSEKLFVVKPYFKPTAIHLTIDSTAYHNEITLYPDIALSYSTTLNLRQVLGIAEGVYDVSVTYGSAHATAQFYVGNQIAQSVESQLDTLSISTDKESYIPGNTVKLTGMTSTSIPLEGLQFEVTDSENTRITFGSLYPDSNNMFKTSFYLSTVDPKFGNYTITASYGDLFEQYSFTVNSDIRESSVLSLQTDKTVYPLGGIVSINGRLNTVWIPTLDYEILQIGSNLNAGTSSPLRDVGQLRVQGDGTFMHEFTIPNNTNRLGTYRVVISQDIGEIEVFFTASKDPSTYTVPQYTPIDIQLDNSTFTIGENIAVYGVVDPSINTQFHSQVISIEIKRYDGRDVVPGTKGIRGFSSYSLTALPDIGGNYRFDDIQIFNTGKYIAKASFVDGKYTASIPFEVTERFDIDSDYEITINDTIFGLGDTVIINGLVPNISSGIDIIITLVKPDGNLDKYGAIVENSKFSWQWDTPIAEKKGGGITTDRTTTSSVFGVYEVIVDFASESVVFFIKVSKNPETDTLSILPFTVSVDKKQYSVGETILVTGHVERETRQNQGVIVQDRAHLEIVNKASPRDIIYSVFSNIDNAGNFQSSFILPVSLFESGTYNLLAEFAPSRSITSFTVQNDITASGGDLTLDIATDKSQYHPGQTVQISGKSNKLVHLNSVDISILSENHLSPMCGSFLCGVIESKVTVLTDSTNGFKSSYKIPSNFDSIGRYEIIASTEFGLFSLEFNVTQSLDEISQARPTRITEKFNRISDNSTIISLTEKIEDGVKLYPRIIQGSFFSLTQTNASDVDLRVSTNGICVIGPGCLVSESTRSPGKIFTTIDLNGISYKIRYSGPDVDFEKFVIVPESDDISLTGSTWIVDIIKDDQLTRFYYKVTYVS